MRVDRLSFIRTLGTLNRNGHTGSSAEEIKGGLDIILVYRTGQIMRLDLKTFEGYLKFNMAMKQITSVCLLSISIQRKCYLKLYTQILRDKRLDIRSGVVYHLDCFCKRATGELVSYTDCIPQIDFIFFVV